MKECLQLLVMLVNLGCGHWCQHSLSLFLWSKGASHKSTHIKKIYHISNRSDPLIFLPYLKPVSCIFKYQLTCIIQELVVNDPRNNRTVNGGKNNRLSTITTAKTFVTWSSAFVWVLPWVVNMSVHCTVCERGTIELFLFYTAHVTSAAPQHFPRECSRAHQSCPHVFVYLCTCMHVKSMQTAFIHNMYALTSYPHFKMCCVCLICVNLQDAS